MTSTSPLRAARAPLAARIEAIEWTRVAEDLNSDGYAVLERLLDSDDTAALAAMYSEATRFRSRVVMEHHGYGRGEYQYFAYPLPGLVAELRERLYERLVPVASAWSKARGRGEFPARHSDYIAHCHAAAAAQTRPTPLLLRYGEGDYNRLHQDIYGEEVFPLQVTILLSSPETDFAGGEFVMTEHRARMQSRPMVVPLSRGDAVIFAVRDRPVRSARGFSNAVMRHGVSVLRRGTRLTAGIIFHDAR